jgi:hypothetical protein
MAPRCACRAATRPPAASTGFMATARSAAYSSRHHRADARALGVLGIAAALHPGIPERKPATIVTGSNFSPDVLPEPAVEADDGCAGRQDIEDQSGHTVPCGVIVDVVHQGADDPVAAVRRADMEPPDLCRVPSARGEKAGAAGGLAGDVGDQEDSRAPQLTGSDRPMPQTR